jgi:hypothetical protein
MSDRPNVKNAADPEQVEKAGKKVGLQRENELADLKAVLAMPQGRRFIWRLICHCSVFESIWHPSALIHANAGRQDVGHFILVEVNEANEEALFQMMRENKEKKNG